MILAFLAQSILHGLIAAFFVEALLGRCRVGDAGWRLRFRALALAIPLLADPVLFAAAPFRESAAFAARWALFAGERWNQVRVGGVGLGSLALLGSAGLGSALFLRDAVPPLLDLLRGGRAIPDAARWHAAADALRPVVERQAARFGVAPPGIRVVQASSPVLMCEGVRRPVLTVSPVTLERIHGEELDAAVAHELAHVAHRDPAWGYALVLVRGLLFFNPAVQWVARAMVDDIERRADQAAVRVTGRAAALARVIIAVFHADNPPPGDGDASFERVFWRIRREGVERRCARLALPDLGAPVCRGRALFALSGAVLLALTFFVV